MKLIAILAILVHPGGADAQCPICPNDGLSVPGTTVINESGGRTFTCGGLIADALSEEEDGEVCAAMMTAQALCCPDDDEDDGDDGDDDEDGDDGEDDDSSCPVCTGGLTVDPDTVIPYDEARGASCRDMMGYASNTPADRGDCIEMKKAQVVCCPNDVAADADGDADEDGDVDGDDATDDDVVVDVVDAANQPTNDEDDAASTDADADDDAIVKSCPVCTGGIAVDGSTVINESNDGRKFTCGGLVVDALDVEGDSEICRAMMTAEVLCCPTVPNDDEDDDDEDDEDETTPETIEGVTTTTTTTNEGNAPCPVCSEGIAVPGTTVITESGGITRTCGGLIVDALDVDANSRICEEMMTAEALCCPTDDDDGDEDDTDIVDDEATTTTTIEPTTPTYIEELLSSSPTIIAPATIAGYPSLAPKATDDPVAYSPEVEIDDDDDDGEITPAPVPTASSPGSYEPTTDSSPIAMMIDSPSPSSSSSSSWVDLGFDYLPPSTDAPTTTITTPSPERAEYEPYPEASEPVFEVPPTMPLSSSGSSLSSSSVVVAGCFVFDGFGSFAMTAVLASVAWYGGWCI